MRALSITALLLAPSVALSLPTASRINPQYDHDAALVIAFQDNRLRSDARVESLQFFHLDISQAREPCDSPRVRLDGYLLSQDDIGAGQGTFASAKGSIVTASWQFTCRRDNVAWDQDLVLTILSLDGRPVNGLGLAIGFKQTGRVRTVNISPQAVSVQQKLDDLNGDDEDDQGPAERVNEPEVDNAWGRLFSASYYFNACLLMLVAKTSLIIGLVLFGILHCARHGARRQRFVARMSDRYRSWAQRRARRRARREAIRSFIRGILHGRHDGNDYGSDEKEHDHDDAAVGNEKEPFSTVEEEIAEFRNAVNLVDDLIRVEEGRLDSVKAEN